MNKIKINLITLLIIGMTGCSSDSDESASSGSLEKPSTELSQELQSALAKGDHSLVSSEQALIEGALQQLQAIQLENEAIKAALFVQGGLSSINWHPTHDAAIISPTFGFNDTILNVNQSFDDTRDDQVLPIGVAGHFSALNTKFIALGGNPMRNAYKDSTALNEPMHQFLDNSLQWLSGFEPQPNAPLNVVIAHLSSRANSSYFPDEEAVRSWLDERYSDNVSYNESNACDANALSECLEENHPDVVILSQHLNNTDTLLEFDSALADLVLRGVPILYLHLDGHLTEVGRSIFDELHLEFTGDNYWKRLLVENFDPASLTNQLPDDIELQRQLLNRFKDQSFSLDLTLCDDKACPLESDYEAQFLDAADSIQATLSQLDEQNLQLFDSHTYTYQKLLVLLGDRFRSQVTYPMDKVASEQLSFLKSLYADFTVYNSRNLNFAQPDLGNFSRSDFNHITPVSTTVNIESKKHFKAAGVYALPGQTFTVTRNDNSDIETKIFINTLRDGATHQFSSGKNGTLDEGDYRRPKFLRTPSYPISSGQTLTLTSAHGGPVQIWFEQNGEDISLEFSNVGRHPIWRTSADDQAFTIALQTADYDWAEISTAGFEVHSTTTKMLSSLENNYFSTPSELANATLQYTSNYPHVLAGFQGPGIDVVDEIENFATDKGWDIGVVDIVKHMNADQATCGSGCSGNPYDAYWAFSPVGHGDLHELGHGLEKGKFRFEGFEGHASTNFYSYYSKSQFFKETGNDPSCQNLPFETLYDHIQDSLLTDDPGLHMRNQQFSSWNIGAAIYVQLMMALENDGALNNGWHVYGRLHTLFQNFSVADNSDELWMQKRDSLGFGLFSREEATSLGNNDWLLVALSYVSERDLSSYLSMWGFEFSDKALDQVAAEKFEAINPMFYASGSSDYCKTFDHETLPLDGFSLWFN